MPPAAKGCRRRSPTPPNLGCVSEPRRNRVDPWGRLIAVPDRGAWMGNRGQLHDDEGRIRREHQLERWITCVLEFKGRRRQVMSPGLYTELFFLDEATSFAAGHRPCAECRRADYNVFREAWAEGRHLGETPRAPVMDAQLQGERLASGEKVTFEASVSELPDGVFAVGVGGRDDRAPHLLRGGRWHAWTPGGYADGGPAAGADRVRVLTPSSTVAAFAAGYEPQIGT